MAVVGVLIVLVIVAGWIAAERFLSAGLDDLLHGIGRLFRRTSTPNEQPDGQSARSRFVSQDDGDR